MNLLITGAWKDCQDHFKNIVSCGHKIEYLGQETDQLPCDPRWVEGIIGNGIFLYHPIEQFENLKYIQLTSAGYDRVPMEYIITHGIEINNARGVYSIPIAEYTIAGVLFLYKKMEVFFKQKEERVWTKQRDLCELYGKVVCILGCGSIGEECAKRFKIFGCRVNGVDLKGKENEYFDEIYCVQDLEMAMLDADIIVITLPLTNETKNLLDFPAISKCKKGVIIVCVSRGGIIKEETLIKGILEGIIKGAVIDVFDNEPLNSNSELWELENVILTPHNSFVGENNSNRLSTLILDKLEREKNVREKL